MIYSRLVSTLFVMQVASYGAEEVPLFTWWVVNPLVKVKPLDPPPNPAATSADLYAGRNEFEPFQIVLRPEARDASDVDVEVSDFRTSQGVEISKSNITVYVEQFIRLVQPSSIDGGIGWWPDALVPRVDRYANERRNAFPLTVRRGHNQPLWVEVFVPQTAQPGKYTAYARVTQEGIANFVVPIHLTVWAFELPSTATLKSSFGLSGITALKQHRGRYTNDADLYALTRLYAKAALMHRISIYGGSMVPPKYQYDGRHMDLDWRDYDSEVGPFLDGTALSVGEPLHDARATTVDLRTPATFEAPDQQAAYRVAWVKHFKQKGWYDRLFLYLWDEPPAGDRQKVIERGRAALQADPTLRTLLTVPFSAMPRCRR
ncbi:MAG: hypothetical protein ABSB35_31410 [Bryobacteraceae bacterium]|jgi:hypothetical protein